MVGAPPLVVTVKFVVEPAVPFGVVTAMGPVNAVAGTVAVICVELLITKDALTLLKATAEAEEKFVPVITTEDPTGPEGGAKLVMVGGWLFKM